MLKMIALSLFLAASLCAQIVVAPPYLQINGIYYIPRADMLSTQYVGGEGVNYDSRPMAATNSGLSWQAFGDAPFNMGANVHADTTMNGNWLVHYGGSSQGGFYLAGYKTTPFDQLSVQATFDCAGGFFEGFGSGFTTYNSSVYGMGCGPAIWDNTSRKLYTMAYYSANNNFPGATTIGSFVVLQTWCFDLLDYSCPGGVQGPVWLNNDLGLYPVSGGIQSYRIEYGPYAYGVGAFTFAYLLDGTNWIQLKAFLSDANTTTPHMAGVFVSPGTMMNLYAIGGIY